MIHPTKRYVPAPAFALLGLALVLITTHIFQSTFLYQKLILTLYYEAYEKRIEQAVNVAPGLKIVYIHDEGGVLGSVIQMAVVSDATDSILDAYGHGKIDLQKLRFDSIDQLHAIFPSDCRYRIAKHRKLLLLQKTC
jgi:hypothetical protein